MRLLILLVLFTTACGHKLQVSIDPQVQPYVDRFVQASGEVIQINDLIVELVPAIPEGGDDLAYCTWGDNQTPRVQIVQWFWDQTGPNTGGDSDTLRELVVFHELGHCVLFRPHRNDTFQMSIPGVTGNAPSTAQYPYSIMYYEVDQMLVNTSYYEQNRENYMQELFQRE